MASLSGHYFPLGAILLQWAMFRPFVSLGQLVEIQINNMLYIWKTYFGHRGTNLLLGVCLDTCIFFLKSERIFSEYGWFLGWNKPRRGRTLDTSLLWGVVLSGYKNHKQIYHHLFIIMPGHFQKATGSSNCCLRLQTAPQCTTLVLCKDNCLKTGTF